jgi:hypothetical protein
MQSPDPDWLFLLVKMLSTASIVVAASWVAERSGPLLAALVATLPVSAGPVYAFLALEHGDAFIAEATLGSIAANLATAGFCLAYVLWGSRLSTGMALVVSLGVHLLLLMAFRAADLPFALLLPLTIAVYGGLHWVVRAHLHVRAKAPPKLAWHALPIRATLVATLVALVTTASQAIGPTWSGLLATMPIVLSTLILFLQPRIGGPATGAIIASCMLGLMGFGLALAAVHLAALPLGKWVALGLGLAICVGWNFGVGALARLRPRPI